MDILILVGFIVVILVVISPILSIIALNRASRLEQQFSQQNQRIAFLEKELQLHTNNLQNNHTESTPSSESLVAEQAQHSALATDISIERQNYVATPTQNSTCMSAEGEPQAIQPERLAYTPGGGRKSV